MRTKGPVSRYHLNSAELVIRRSLFPGHWIKFPDQRWPLTEACVLFYSDGVNCPFFSIKHRTTFRNTFLGRLSAVETAFSVQAYVPYSSRKSYILYVVGNYAIVWL